MNTSEFRIINFRDEEFFLNKKPRGQFKCMGCDNAFVTGGTLVFGFRPTNRYRYCYKCLSKMETVLRKGRSGDFENWDMYVRHIESDKTCIMLGKEYTATRLVHFPNITLSLSDEAYEILRRELSHFNETQNNYLLTKKEKEKSLNTKLAQKEQKLKLEAMNLIRWVKEQPLIDYYYSLDSYDRANFLNQMIGQNSYSEPTEILRKGSPRNSSKFTLKICSADQNVKCSIHPLNQRIPADFHIFEQGKQYHALNITSCSECCEDLLKTLNTVLCDPLMKRADGQHTSVVRKEYNQECFYCGSPSYIEIRWGNAILHFCEQCAKKFYEGFDKRLCKLIPDRQQTPIKQKEYIHIEERMLTHKRKATRSVHTIGSKASDLLNTETEFIVRTDFYPCDSDNIGHMVSHPTNYYLCTNNSKIGFDLALSKACVPRILSVFKNPDKRIVGYGKPIWMNERVFQGTDHCLFCMNSEGKKHRIHIGDIEFSCCDKHLKMLIKKLEELQ